MKGKFNLFRHSEKTHTHKFSLPVSPTLRPLTFAIIGGFQDVIHFFFSIFFYSFLFVAHSKDIFLCVVLLRLEWIPRWQTSIGTRTQCSEQPTEQRHYQAIRESEIKVREETLKVS